MKTYDTQYFKQLAHDLMFDISEAEAKDIQDEFKTLLLQIEAMAKIDTDDVSEMIYPFDEATSFMREDQNPYQITQEEALQNAPQTKLGHVFVAKVVK